MPTKKARLQVILRDEATEQVKALADERGLSVSAMLSELVHAALLLPQFRHEPDVRQLKAEAIKAAMDGGEINDFKIKALLSLVEHLAE